MKIAYFLDFPNNIGGSNKVLLTQAYIMKERGHQTVVVIPDDKETGHASVYDELCIKYGLNVITAEFCVSTCMEGINVLSVFEHYDEVLNILKKEKMDLIHSTQMNITVEMAARELHIPHLMNIYQTDVEAFHITWMDVYPHFHSTDSELLSKRWRDGLHIPSKCIRVAYRNKICDEVNREKRVPLKLLSIGGLTERKNQLEIIKLVSICKNNGIPVNLTLLGNEHTTYGKECMRFVEQKGLIKEVTFRGFVSNVEEYFKKSDVFILASKVESFPGVIVESMANRVPILSTPVAGVPELLQDEYNAFLTEGFSGEDLYEAFRRYLLFRDNDNIQNIIDCAYKTYLDNHTYEVVGGQLERYYNWIITNYKGGNSQLLIDNVEKFIGGFISRIGLEKADLHTKNNLWLLYHLDKIVRFEQPQRIAIWGAGLWGKTALSWLEILNCVDRIIGFIDTYKDGTYLGHTVFKATKELIESCDMILVAIGNMNLCLEVMKNLDSFGKVRNKDYFMMLNAPMRI